MKKRIIALAAAMILIVSALAFTSCGGRTTLTGDMDENGKAATYTLNKADKDDFVMTGTLIVGEDEQIVIDSQLEKGSMQFEFISSDGSDEEENVPDTEGNDATYTAYVSGVESQAVSFGAGEYMVKATVTEGKTTGTVNIEVKGLGEADGSEAAE